MRAKYEFSCPVCQDRVRVGDDLGYFKDISKWVCGQCKIASKPVTKDQVLKGAHKASTWRMNRRGPRGGKC